MSLVLDSSVTLAWCFDDERTPTTDTLLDRVVDSVRISAIVTAHFRFSVTGKALVFEGSVIVV